MITLSFLKLTIYYNKKKLFLPKNKNKRKKRGQKKKNKKVWFKFVGSM